MDDADAAFLRERDRRTRFGDGVHRGGDQRNGQANLGGELRGRVGVLRQDLRGSGHQQDVVEREAFEQLPRASSRGTSRASRWKKKPGRTSGLAFSVANFEIQERPWLHLADDYR